MKSYYVYILVNWNNKIMYIGVTNNLERRMAEHQSGTVPGFTQKYFVNKLVYVEEASDVIAAIAREKQIKGWRREKENALVETINPGWVDMSKEDPSLMLGMTEGWQAKGPTRFEACLHDQPATLHRH